MSSQSSLDCARSSSGHHRFFSTIVPVIRKYSRRSRIRRDCGHVHESHVSRRAGCGAPGRAGSAMENRTTRPAAAACRRRTGGRPSRPVVISGVRRSKVAVLAWGRPAAWKGMLSLALRDDQKAKNEAVCSYQFSYQLAHRTGQKLSNFSPVHSVRDRGTECTVHRAENSRRREVAKPGIALGSGPRDRGFESRLPDHSQRVQPWNGCFRR